MAARTGAAGKPVVNADMVDKRDALVGTLGTIRVPDNRIDMIVNAFGADTVAKNIGRSRAACRKRTTGRGQSHLSEAAT